jgi:hypothetical protein
MLRQVICCLIVPLPPSPGPAVPARLGRVAGAACQYRFLAVPARQAT